MEFKWLVLFAALTATIATTGCWSQTDNGVVKVQHIKIDDVNKGYAELLDVKSNAWWDVMDNGHQAWVVNLDGNTKFIPLESQPNDAISQLSGPLDSLTSRITIPIVAPDMVESLDKELMGDGK